MKLLEIKQLEAAYDKVQILHGVDLHVNQGEIVSIIGPNGAGKSTVLKSVFGLVPKRKGQIVFAGKHIIKNTAEQIVAQGISFVLQGRSVFSSMTVKENLELGTYVQGVSPKRLQEVLDRFPRLRERLNQKAGLMSGGEQQMVSIARALMMQPKLLILDEPSLGLSPPMKQMIMDKLIEIKKSGVTILMVEQNARMALGISDRAYVLELGKNKLTGTGKDLLRNKQVEKLYLGGH